MVRCHHQLKAARRTLSCFPGAPALSARSIRNRGLDGAGSLGPGSGPMSRSRGVYKSELNSVAKTTPIEFFRQVQAETRKVVWPTRRETIMTGVMVMIMTTLLAVFFFVIDTIFEALVKFLLSLAG